jgi:hypothetical protein
MSKMRGTPLRSMHNKHTRHASGETKTGRLESSDYVCRDYLHLSERHLKAAGTPIDKAEFSEPQQAKRSRKLHKR